MRGSAPCSCCCRSPASCRASPRSSPWTGTSRAMPRPPSRCWRRAISSISGSRTRPGTRSRSASTGCRAPAVAIGEALGVPEARTTIALYRMPSLFGAIATVLLTYWAALAFFGRRGAFLTAALMATCDHPHGRGAARQDGCDAHRLLRRRDGRPRPGLSEPGAGRPAPAGAADLLDRLRLRHPDQGAARPHVRRPRGRGSVL